MVPPGLARPAGDGPVPPDQPDPAGGGPGCRADRRLVLLERGDAPASSGSRGGCRRTCSRASRLHIDYTLENDRRWTAALALFVEDDLVAGRPDRIAGRPAWPLRSSSRRSAAGDRMRVRWQGPSPRRGQVSVPHRSTWSTRSPFGLLERRETIAQPDQLLVYPTVGQLTRRWHLVQRQASETRRGQRHDRSAQQQEYHGLREYRPGDSPRWIHWRTSARIGKPMVKEFEQQNEQDLAVLIDPWLPRSKVTPESARGARAGDPVRRDGLPGDLPAPGPAAPAGLDRPDARGPPGAGFGEAAARTARATGRDAAGDRGEPGRLVRCAAAGDAPRGDPDRRLDPAGQPPRGGRAVGAALGTARHAGCWAGRSCSTPRAAT